MKPLSLLLLLVATTLCRAAAAAGPAAPSGEVKTTGDQTNVVTLPDGVVVALEPGTQGRWLPKGRLPSETNSWAVGYHLLLVEGEVEVGMPPGPKGSHAFLVQTRAGTLTDWRGKLHVTVHDDKTTAAIYEGALVVGSNGQGFPVYDGAGILMRKGIDPDKSRTIPPAPPWDSEHGASSLLVEPTGSRGTVGFSWKPVPGAASYRVAIARDAAMTQMLEVATTTDTSYAMVERTAGAGCWARVRTISTDGIVGEWSAPRALRIVHYTLPDGATVARDGAVVIPPHAAVTLSETDGLEVAYGTLNAPASVPLYWSSLTGPLRLSDDVNARVFHLRDPSLGQEATLTLARRTLRVTIDITPRDPRPGDAIDIRAVAFDPSRRLDPTQEKITIDTTLDLDPVRVAWQQAGNTWAARVRLPPTTAPTVLRVVAHDAAGLEIGRGFVEMGTAQAGGS